MDGWIDQCRRDDVHIVTFHVEHLLDYIRKWVLWLKFLGRSRGINLIAKYFLVGTENCMLIHFVTNNTSCQIECMAPNKKQVIGGKYICIAYGWHNTSVIKAYRVQH